MEDLLWQLKEISQTPTFGMVRPLGHFLATRYYGAVSSGWRRGVSFSLEVGERGLPQGGEIYMQLYAARCRAEQFQGGVLASGRASLVAPDGKEPACQFLGGEMVPSTASEDSPWRRK